MADTATTSVITPMIGEAEALQREFNFDPTKPGVPRLVPRVWAGDRIVHAGENISYGKHVEDPDEARAIGWALYRAFGIGNTELLAAVTRGYLEAAEWQRRGSVPSDIRSELDA